MTVSFTFDWVDAAPSPDGVMGQTMAQLWIRVNGEAVTAVYDRRNNARRDHVVVPLLSVAEWVVGNWCHLWHELPDTTGEMARQKPGFEQRHNLAFAGDGFLWPKLTMVPSSDAMEQLRWTPWQPQHARIEFVAEGKVRVACDQLQEELGGVVEAVLERLRNFGHRQDSVVSDLQDAWDTIKALDPEEDEFCRAAALLGVDPFAVEQDMEEAIIAFWQRTETAIREDMLASLDEATLPGASRWLDHTRAWLEDEDNGNEWGAIRDGLPPVPMTTPWQQGYALARSLRRALSHGDGQFDFAAPGQPALHHRETAMPSSRIEGLVAAGGPACAITSQRRETTAKRFVLARALGDYMGRSEAGLGILTSMDTMRQARSRAFAAELLAPAESLRPRLADRGAEENVIHDLGQEFAVSPWVINHQIRNHGLPQPCSSGLPG
ncbi:MAG: hypothetical protein F4Z75_06585 [Synechococcus sp. SB0668_bin_15]|nr:hypothetical protein [Synechococcus sp. SB0668_bin_15]MYC49017.1 hypothetical protein [Synechococcus sp. SB0662_bin_14]